MKYKYTGKVFNMNEFKFIDIAIENKIASGVLKNDESIEIVLHPDSEKADAGIWAEVVREVKNANA